MTLTQREDHDLRVLRDSNGSRNIGAVVEVDSRIGQERAQAIEDADSRAVLFVFIVAVPRDRGIGPDECDVPDRFRQRKETALILQQGHGLARRCKRECKMIAAAFHASRQGGVGERMVEEAERELHPQHGGCGTVESIHRECVVFDCRDDRSLKHGVVEIVELHIDARIDGFDDRIARACRHAVILPQPPNRTQVGQNESLKAPILAQNLIQQCGVGGNGHAVDLVIRRHNAHCMSIADCRLKSLEHDGAQLTLSNVDRRSVESAFGRAMSDEMLRLRNH